jgi:hypothetical protein
VSLAVDASDNVYTAGDFIGTVDFDPGAGTANVAAADRDLFILKLNSLGSFVWVRTMASVSEFSPDEGLGLAVDASGDVFLTADFEGTVDVDPGAGTYNLTAGGVGDVLVEKLDSAGNFVWAKAIGSTTHTGPGREEGLDIAVDALGNVHFTGQFFQTADFDPGAGVANLTAHGENDGFVCKLKYATWVDFAFAGSEIGSEDSPFNSITEALLSAPASTTVFIKGDTADSSSGETIVIDQAVAIEAVNGAVRIGETGAGFGESKASSEFVGRR